jgi:Acyltransferase
VCGSVGGAYGGGDDRFACHRSAEPRSTVAFVAESLGQIARRQLQDSMRFFQRPELVPYARFAIEGTERIPRDGPLIVVFNHRSYFDGTALSRALSSTRARESSPMSGPMLKREAKSVTGNDTSASKRTISTGLFIAPNST